MAATCNLFCAGPGSRWRASARNGSAGTPRRAAAAGPPAGLPSALAARRAEITAEPRRYGFHATLKAPFRLAAGATVAALDAAAAALAAGQAGFALRLRVAEVGRFVALVPEGDAGAVAALAAACVTGLDGFRAPPSAEELARRRAAGLDARGEAHLARWGYPYVLDRFRFHMTLTGALGEDRRARWRRRWRRRGAAAGGRRWRSAAICRFSEGADGRFRLVRRFPLGG